MAGEENSLCCKVSFDGRNHVAVSRHNNNAVAQADFIGFAIRGTETHLPGRPASEQSRTTNGKLELDFLVQLEFLFKRLFTIIELGHGMSHRAGGELNFEAVEFLVKNNLAGKARICGHVERSVEHTNLFLVRLR